MSDSYLAVANARANDVRCTRTVTVADDLHVLSWNILADKWVDPQRYQLCCQSDLAWSNRGPRIVAELLSSGAHVIMLQEVEAAAFANVLLPALAAAGYQGLASASSEMPGNATFWLQSRLKLRWSQQRSRTLAAILQDSENSCAAAFVNCHLEGDPRASLKRIQQLQSALHGLQASGEAHASVVVAGDFNATPESSVAAYLAFGSVPTGACDAWGLAGAVEVPAEACAVPAHPYEFSSCYADEADAVSYAPAGRRGWHGMLDHVWFEQRALACVRPRALYPSHAAREALLDGGLPSTVNPSDHLPCGGTLRWRECSATIALAPKKEEGPSAEELLREAAELLAACPFATEAQRAEWLEVSGTTLEKSGQKKPSPEELAAFAARRRRKEELLAEVPSEAASILQRVLQLQKEAKKAAARAGASSRQKVSTGGGAHKKRGGTACASARAGDHAAAAASTTAVAAVGTPRAQSYRLLAIVDFEKTCEREAPLVPQEIIELPTLLLDVSVEGCPLVGTFHEYVRPSVHPQLSEFCTEVTGISQSLVDAADPLGTVLERHRAWLCEHGASPDGSGVLFLTCGDYDLKRSLPEDPNVDESKLPACYGRWCNLKKAFGAHMGLKKNKQPAHMAEMLDTLGLELEGHHHSGIDDCKNLAKIVRAMLQRGWIAEETGRIPPRL